MSDRNARDRSSWRDWWKQPALHFVLLGALVFAVDAWRSPVERPDQIVVSADKVERLRRSHQKRTGSMPDEQTTRRLVDEYVTEEILYREGKKLGLHESDSIVRRRIIQEMRFVTEDLTPVREATQQQLRSYFEEHRQDYVQPDRLSFVHVYFREGADEAELNTSLDELRDGVDSSGMGAPFGHGHEFEKSSLATIEHRFGSSFAASLRELPTGEWAGPVRSSYGLHLVRVDEHVEGSVPELEEVRREVVRDWRADAREAANRKALENLRDDYEVDVEWGGR